MNTNTKAAGPTEKNLPIGEAAKRLGLTRGALQLRLHRGTFPVPAIQYTEGGRRYFPAGEIDALAEGGLAALDIYRQVKHFQPRHVTGMPPELAS